MTNQEYIKKLEVLKKDGFYDSQSETEGFQNALSMAIIFARELDSPKECEFIEIEDVFEEWSECSACKRKFRDPFSWLQENVAVHSAEDFNFCPHCGCKIKREVENDESRD